ncbi:MAG TPA: nucleotidyltransferase domain-containing protein [Bacteroidia bacterium]|jgi:predicted nucleotidyltransferase|nr:nucleotidyltransferase domain-containing protein [Bacteroidia bacterium]
MELSHLKKQITDILRNYPVSKAALFGSFAKGIENKDSDIDVLIESNGPITLFQILKLEKDIEKATKRKTDIVEYSAIKSSIRKNFLKDFYL